jgi:hypothetical protein
MIQAHLILYPIVYNKQYSNYQILSDFPDKYSECYTVISEEKDIETQIYNLFSEYFDLDPGYIKFVQLNSSIKEKKLLIHIYCLVPYLVKLKKGFLIPINLYATHIEPIRKILNII